MHLSARSTDWFFSAMAGLVTRSPMDIEIQPCFVNLASIVLPFRWLSVFHSLPHSDSNSWFHLTLPSSCLSTLFFSSWNTSLHDAILWVVLCTLDWLCVRLCTWLFTLLFVICLTFDITTTSSMRNIWKLMYTNLYPDGSGFRLVLAVSQRWSALQLWDKRACLNDSLILLTFGMVTLGCGPFAFYHHFIIIKLQIS